MKKRIIALICLLCLFSTPVFSGSPYPERNKKDEARAYTGQLPYHMMLYEKSEEEAQDQYSTIVKSPEKENSEPKQNTGEEGKTKGIPE